MTASSGRRPGARGWRAALRVVAIGLGVVVIVLVAGYAALRLTAPAPRPAAAWSAAAPLPGPRGESAGAVLDTDEGERLAVVGGLRGLGRTTDAVTLYDPGADAWTRAPALPGPRHHPAAAGLDGRLHVTGGTASAVDLGAATPQLWAWEPGGEAWEELEPLPRPRWGHRLIAHDGRLYAVGGRPGARVQIYEPEEGWRLGAPIPEVRDHLGVVAHDEELWALGGRDADEELTARVDVYDPARDTWRAGPDLPAPVSAAAVGVVDARIHVVDGEDPATLGGGVLDAHWVLDPAVGSWEPGAPSRLPVHGAADGVVGGRLHVAGGATRQGALSVTAWTDEVQVLDPG